MSRDSAARLKPSYPPISTREKRRMITYINLTSRLHRGFRKGAAASIGLSWHEAALDAPAPLWVEGPLGLLPARPCAIASAVCEVVDGPIAGIDPRLVRGPGRDEVGVAANVGLSVMPDPEIDLAVNHQAPLIRGTSKSRRQVRVTSIGANRR